MRSAYLLDVNLVGLAAHNGGKPATLDRHIPVNTVGGSQTAVELIAPYSAARKSGYTFARAASFAGKALAPAQGTSHVLGPPRGPFREGRAAAPPRTLPSDCAAPSGLSPILRTAQ